MANQRKIAVISAKGGVGKTTLVSNLGVALVAMGKRVCIIDGNVTASCLGMHFGLYAPKVKLDDVICKRNAVADAVYAHWSGVHVLPSTHSVDASTMEISELGQYIQGLRGYDFLIFDSSPAMGPETAAVLSLVDEAILIAVPTLPDVVNAAKMAEFARRMNVKISGIVLNRVRGREYEMPREKIEELCGAKVLAALPESEIVPRSIVANLPAVQYEPYSPIAWEINRIAFNICGFGYAPPGKFQRLKNYVYRLLARGLPPHMQNGSSRGLVVDEIAKMSGEYDELARLIITKQEQGIDMSLPALLAMSIPADIKMAEAMRTDGEKERARKKLAQLKRELGWTPNPNLKL